MCVCPQPSAVAAEPATLRSPGWWRRTPLERCCRFGFWQCRCVRATRADIVRVSCLDPSRPGVVGLKRTR